VSGERYVATRRDQIAGAIANFALRHIGTPHYRDMIDGSIRLGLATAKVAANAAHAHGDDMARSGVGVLSFRGSPVGAVQGGCLCFEGTRIPVATILSLMGDRAYDASILSMYPSLTQLDLDAARWFDDKWQVRRRRVAAASKPSALVPDER
jgi:uncharacterized protein (DUF433 family)